MNPTATAIERCRTFINCQLQPAMPAKVNGPEPRRPIITLSRQAGCGAHIIGQKLADLLQADNPNPAHPWTVFDRDLVQKVLDEHHLPKALAKFMPEDRISEMADIMDELFGLHPPSWELVRETAETILHLAELGNVIIIGRGAHLITRKLPFAFHVRLVGSWERRLENLHLLHQLDKDAAHEFIRKEDRGRRRYLKKYFGKDITDPLLYHLLINIDLVDFDLAARIIADAVTAANPAAVTAVKSGILNNNSLLSSKRS